MKIKSIKIENFRSHKDSTINLRDYNLITGPNSSGKSSIFYAILSFYNNKAIKFNESKDVSKFSDGKPCKVKVDYELAPGDNNIRKLLKLDSDTNSISISYDFNKKEYKCETDPSISSKDIKNFLKLTKIIFIPAIPDSSDAFKLTGPSLMKETLTDILKVIWEPSQESAQINKELKKSLSVLNSTKNKNGISPKDLTEKLNNAIKSVNLNIRFDTKDIDFSTVITNLYDILVTDTILNQDIDQTTISTGQMKYLFYSLIKVLNDINVNREEGEENSQLNFLIFEEPEAYLHPSYQLSLAEIMRDLSKSDEWQCAISSHSPYFISKEIEHMQDIVRIERKEKGISKVFQIDENKFQILRENGDFIDFLNELKNKKDSSMNKNLKKEIKDKIENHDRGLDEFMYNLYLNSERSRLFLSNKVIICEGISDKVLIDYFIRLKGENYISEIYVLETNGKYDMVRYMKLLDYFGIKYGIVYDTDSDKSIDESLAKNLNKYIEEYIKNHNNNSTYFDKLLFEPNLEEENGFFIKKNDDLKGVNKPLYILKKIEENELPNFQGTKVKIEDFIEKLHKF